MAAMTVKARVQTAVAAAMLAPLALKRCAPSSDCSNSGADPLPESARQSTDVTPRAPSANVAPMEMDAVTSVTRAAADVAILPRFRALAAGDVMRKSAGEVVTIADREAENFITPRLRALVDAPVVVEEAAADNPGLIAAVRDAPVAWVVDPLDGTANFVAGRPEYAVMAALIQQQQTVAAWILRPAEDSIYVAERGSGTWRNGSRVWREPASHRTAELRGVAHARYLDASVRARVRAA